MKFLTFSINGNSSLRVGCLLQDTHVLDLEKADGNAVSSPFADMLTLIERGDPGVAYAEKLRREALAGAHGEAIVPLDQLCIAAPIPRPRKNIFCVGRNYSEHIHEGNAAQGIQDKAADFPEFFTKAPTAVLSSGGLIPDHSETTSELDYEGELGVVIGRLGSNIPKERSLDYVFGYTIINDVTARDLQRNHGQWFKGKTLDGSCPMGPVILYRTALANPQNVTITTRVNGEIRQNSSTSNMIFDVRSIIEDLSKGLTLEPGDIIATGTPSGVGYAMKPPHFLKRGDTVTCEIDRIGTLSNKIG